ncbi:MAG: ABC transporter ATP-binding protein [Motiliproteus sp.]
MITLEAINKTYEVGGAPLHALQQINLDIKDAEYLAITGPSGSGKSTLLNMIGLLDRPDQGRYLLDGVATETLNEESRARLRRQKIGFIFQAFHLVPRLTAYENIELPLMLAEHSRAVRREQVNQVLDQVGLLSHCQQRPGQLSGGQMQRIAIARAIVMRPQILLADEPTGNLDHRSGEDIVELLESLNQQGMTVLMVTHNPELAQRATRKLTLVDGIIVGDEHLTSPKQ